MRFLETRVEGAFIVETEPRRDERGFFARIWCQDEFRARGLDANFVQCNASGSVKRGTLRGLHWQTGEHGEGKLVQCVRGRIYDVFVDLRPASRTHAVWVGVELAAGHQRLVYVPPGCAHGYLTLEDESEVIYPVTRAYHPASERGVRWNDPRFGIEWPAVEALTISEKDRQWPDYTV